VPFFEASAKARLNVEECFYALVREIRKYENQTSEGNLFSLLAPPTSTNHRQIVVHTLHASLWHRTSNLRVNELSCRHKYLWRWQTKAKERHFPNEDAEMYTTLDEQNNITKQRGYLSDRPILQKDEPTKENKKRKKTTELAHRQRQLKKTTKRSACTLKHRQQRLLRLRRIHTTLHFFVIFFCFFFFFFFIKTLTKTITSFFESNQHFIS